MSLYADYIKEREGLELLESSEGFISYKFRDKDCYIQDIYVVPDKRTQGIASKLANEVAALAKTKGYRLLTGSVDFRANGAQHSNFILRAYGMRPYSVENFVTYYLKEIE